MPRLSRAWYYYPARPWQGRTITRCYWGCYHLLIAAELGRCRGFNRKAPLRSALR